MSIRGRRVSSPTAWALWAEAWRRFPGHGTGHGHGTAFWILDGAVQGGRIAGEQVAVGPKTLNQDRDLPVLTEYRGHAARALQAPLRPPNDARLDVVLPRGRTQDLGLL